MYFSTVSKPRAAATSWSVGVSASTASGSFPIVMEGRCGRGRVLLVVGRVAMLLGRETTLKGDETPCWTEPWLLERQTFMSIRVAGLSSQLWGRIDAPFSCDPHR